MHDDKVIAEVARFTDIPFASAKRFLGALEMASPRETLLTPEQAAVIAAAKAYVDFMYGFREELDAVPFVDGLLTAVDAAREVQT